MSLDRNDELLMKIGQAMARSAPEGWKSATLDVTAVHSMMETTFSAQTVDGTVDQSRAIEDDGDEACEELREAMAEPGRGTWYNARFTLGSDGEFNAEFDYENPPFGGDADGQLLKDDQARFPRDPENLAEWHPARQPTDA